MRGLVGLVVLGLVALVTGCSAAPPPPPLAIAQNPDESPIVRDPEPSANEDVPRSIRRLVSEERVKLQDCVRLTQILGDSSGRERARTAAFQLSRELEAIDSALDSADSDRLDLLVDRIHRLSTRVSLLHDALEAAL
jgi:hypothetical protein